MFYIISLDLRVELFLNQFVNHSRRLDWMIMRSEGSHLLHGGVIMVLVWYALFDRHGKDQLRRRYELLLGATLISAVAVLAARGLALVLPFRPRPFAASALHLRLPDGANLELLHWSAFPSDHAVLFFTLATGIFFVSRRLGWLATVWTAVVICFPRLYLGIHWPTDIVAGAILGVGFAYIAKITPVREAVKRLTAEWHREHPGLFFAALFLWSYEIVVLFEDGRRLIWHLFKS